MSEKDNVGCGGCTIGIVELVFIPLTALQGYIIHHSILWAIIDSIFWPIAWIKWLAYSQTTFF